MKGYRPYLLALGVLAAGCGRPPTHESSVDRIVSRACDFLVAQQFDDGGWPSETHGLMSSGQATTPFVFYALLSAPDTVCVFPTDARNAAAGFIRSRVAENGALGLYDPDILDFPNYATAYGVMALLQNGDAGDEPLIHAMAQYLVSQQFTDSRGIDPAHSAYGGWGFGETVFPEGSVGHVDLSHTRRAIEAVRMANVPGSDAYDAVRSFLRLHQKDPSDPRVQRVLADSAAAYYDGGFFASAVVPVVNKSTLIAIDEKAAIFTSYASTTADGLLALLAAGVEWSDDAALDAYGWLERHGNLAYPEGIPEDHPAQWGRVMFFYHLMVRGEVYRAMRTEGEWRQGIADIVAAHQRSDGSFSNPHGAPNKEDDPLLATAMVLIALAKT